MGSSVCRYTTFHVRSSQRPKLDGVTSQAAVRCPCRVIRTAPLRPLDPPPLPYPSSAALRCRGQQYHLAWAARLL